MHKSIRNSKENKHNAFSQMCGKLYLPENRCSAVSASFAENIQVNQFSICSDQVMVQIFLSVKKKSTLSWKNTLQLLSYESKFD